MEMLHLRYFVAVAEELNFSQAARRLHMAASPLSQRIKDLEHELGHKLFDRSTHHVTLTAAGAALLPIARDVLEQVNAIPWRLREAVKPRRSTVFVGIPAGVHPALRERVKRLEERCRDHFELKRWPGTTPDLVAAVHEGKLALSLVRMPVTDPALEIVPVQVERLGAVVPAARFAGRETVDIAELSDLSYIPSASESIPAYSDDMDRKLSNSGIRKRLKVGGTEYSGISELVANGSSFSITMLDPASPMHLFLVDGATILPFADFRPQLETALVWRRDRAEEGDLAELVAGVREIFAEPLST
ncbi:LysR family transcriptional regulator [Amycolatopsis sp. EV170708-02-1]|uniref:LysR family transcriptional regulator n=1 Tax=Amycolatopsis sp. EV170708-02-1 TaxID=2919322 RepID=UPI001F0B9447|nr:LysR family transcriptional regulator [Amycolatopsis sp. EV170708-02-1]UMP07153.1 LysR family transcriptional regulator [Amycolatopsis sp. EV170708-02-1]